MTFKWCESGYAPNMELLLVLVVIPVIVAIVVLRRKRAGKPTDPEMITGNEGHRHVDGS